MRPSDIARGEMKMRKRFLEYLNQGGLPYDPLPACGLPQEANEVGDLTKQRSQEMEAPEEKRYRLGAYAHLGGFLPSEEIADFDLHRNSGA